ncbi:hypothetical protein [Nocardia brasiliensis]|uniref:hypothetical protein n=1 Tax=Nocardia brasiliensis TaxID=37326 RepID=UPI001892D63B|nr:hypothetical protein [Nocardia brasiliensis]MBF6126434.1 hypothetical protein [Nocardia brasiliensis]
MSFEQWPEATALAVRQALQAAAGELSSFETHVVTYSTPDGAYAPLTGSAEAAVFSLEVAVQRPAFRKPGYTVWAIFQVFDPRQPNLALVRTVERRDSDGTPVEDHRRPLYNMELDRLFTRGCLPVFHSALNELDPTGRGQSQFVTCYHGRLTATALVQMPWLGFGLFHRFRSDGQYAVIIADFHEPLGEPLLAVVKYVMTVDARFLPRRKAMSLLRTPLRGEDGTIHRVGGMSTAVDEGFVIARRYLDGPRDRSARASGTASSPSSPRRTGGAK